jgi:hypothetical protein
MRLSKVKVRKVNKGFEVYFRVDNETQAAAFAKAIAAALNTSHKVVHNAGQSKETV